MKPIKVFPSRDLVLSLVTKPVLSEELKPTKSGLVNSPDERLDGRRSAGVARLKDPKPDLPFVFELDSCGQSDKIIPAAAEAPKVV
jgi:hypothetical protein